MGDPGPPSCDLVNEPGMTNTMTISSSTFCFDLQKSSYTCANWYSLPSTNFRCVRRAPAPHSRR